MAEAVRDVRIRVTIDSERVAEGAQRATTALDGLGSAAAEVGPKLKAPFEGVGVEAEQLATEVKQLEVFLKRIEGASSGPLILQRNAELARAAFQVLNEQAQRLGVTLPAAIGERVATSIQTATTQAARMNAELEKMGGQTPTKLDKVISALQLVAAGEGEAAAKAQALNVAMERLANAANDPQRLGRAAAVAAVELENLRDAAAKAGLASSQLAADIANAEAKIDAANRRAGQIRDTMGDLRTRGDLAAKGFEAAAGAAGSLEGMLGRLVDTSGGLGQAIGKAGFAIIGAVGAFELGYNSGKKLRDVFQELSGITLPDYSKKVADALMGTREMGDLFAKLPGTMNTGIKAIQAQGEALSKSLDWLKSAGVQWQDYGAAQKKAEEQIAALAARVTTAADAGKASTKEWALNKEALISAGEAAEKFGINVEHTHPALSEAIKFAQQLAQAEKNLAQNMAEARQETEEMRFAQLALRDFMEEGNQWAKTSEAIVRYRQEVAAAEVATRQFMEASQRSMTGSSESWARIQEEVQRANEAGTEVVATMNILHTTIREASEASVDYIYQISEALNQLAETSPNAADRVANAMGLLVEAARSGVVDLASWNTQWAAYYDQLKRLLALNAGTAFEADLRKMIAALEELRRQVNAGEIGPSEQMRI